MYTDPVIVHTPGGGTRSYVKVQYRGERLRFYTGAPLGIRCFPNTAKTEEERLRLLQHLQYEVKKHLEKGWNPMEARKSTDPYANFTLVRCVDQALKEIAAEDLSARYREDLGRIGNHLKQYLRDEGFGQLSNKNIDPRLLQRFLSQFSSSGSYYMTKRRTLAGLFARMVNSGMIDNNPVHKTTRKKEVHVLNVPFSEPQLKGLMAYLKEAHPQLHLCALLMYGSFLRPHREIRLLRRRHFDDQCTKITLSGTENKSKRIRAVHLPRYVTQALIDYGVTELDADDFIISRGKKSVNEDYFKTAWTREKKHFKKDCKLREGQTLYSFRHTGALAVYQKTKDPYRVQQVMFHSSLKVTLTYLRSLGLMASNDVADLPDLY